MQVNMNGDTNGDTDLTRTRIDDLKSRALEFVTGNPDRHYHRTSLATALGGGKADALKAIKELPDAGSLIGGRWKSEKISLHPDLRNASHDSYTRTSDASRRAALNALYELLNE